MDDAHLTPAGLRKFLEESGDEERNRLLLHQLAVCPTCYLVGGYLLDLYQAGAIDLRFNSLDADLAQSRAEAPELLGKLTRFSFERQKALVRDLPRFRSWGLCELLCQESERLAPDDAALSVERAELAVTVGSLLAEWQPAEELWLYELRAFAWAHLGNAYRVQGILRRARAAFARAEEWWNRAVGNVGDAVGYQAKIFALKASFLTAERRLPEALKALEEALQADPEPELMVAIRINKAKILEEEEDLDGAITLLRETESAIDPEQAPRLYLCLGNFTTIRKDTACGPKVKLTSN